MAIHPIIVKIFHFGPKCWTIPRARAPAWLESVVWMWFSPDRKQQKPDNITRHSWCICQVRRCLFPVHYCLNVLVAVCVCASSSLCNCSPFAPPHRPYTIRRPLIPNSFHSSSGSEGKRSLLIHRAMFHFICTVSVFCMSINNFGFIYLQQRPSTAGWRVSWRCTWRWLIKRNNAVECRPFFGVSLSLSLRSVCREEGFLQAHLWPPCQHQHTPECQIPVRWWDTATLAQTLTNSFGHLFSFLLFVIDS